jgi:Ras-related GTP-binding protein A/B
VTSPASEARPDLLSFASTIQALREYSPSSKIFILVHKMDLIPPERKSPVYHEKVKEIRAACDREGFYGSKVDFFQSSIWDHSLFRAWTQVIYFLVPHITQIESMLQKLAEVINARELILYERLTCLVVTHVTRGAETHNPFADRIERISTLLKRHKQSMSRHTGSAASEVSFAEMQIKTDAFMFFITRLTENTNLAVIMPSDETSFNAARVNVQLARKEFAHLDIIEKKGKEAGHYGAGSGRDAPSRARDYAQ